MTITINGKKFERVKLLRADRVTRRTDIRYNTQGDMLIDLVNRKYELEAEFALLTQDELRELRSFTQEIFVTVAFIAPEGEIEREFHVQEEPAPAVTDINSVTMYGSVKLLFLEK